MTAVASTAAGTGGTLFGRERLLPTMGVDHSLGYYDKILIAIAASLAGGSLVGAATSVAFRLGLLAGALLATVFVYDAVFRHPPQPETNSKARYAAIVWHLFLALLLLPSLR